MKKFIIIGIVAFYSIVAAIVFAEMPGADKDALWEYIAKDNPYTKWSFWPGHEGMQSGRAPHGPLHKVYVNDLALNSSQRPFKYGSIVVKENYNKKEELQAITVMYKISDYNPDAGDWFWVKYSSDGKADKFGKPKGCIACHNAKKTNDFIFVH